MKQNRENPFFETYRTPFGTPPFDQIETEQYEPAFDEGIWQLDEEVRAIADNTELPTFENTIVALERSGKGKRWLLRHLRQAGYPDAEKLFCVEWTPGRGFYIVPLEEPNGRDAAKETLSAD